MAAARRTSRSPAISHERLPQPVDAGALIPSKLEHLSLYPAEIKAQLQVCGFSVAGVDQDTDDEANFPSRDRLHFVREQSAAARSISHEKITHC